jgi:hypothetical protein
MKRAAIAIRVHSGWGALVAVAGNVNDVQVLARSRVTIVDGSAPGATQPYHFAKEQALSDAEKHLARCAASSERLAFTGLRQALDEVGRRGATVAGCAILLASGRPLPALEKILASHPLIHTAEGEFFRQAFWRAAERLDMPAAGFRERELERQAQRVFGEAAAHASRMIASLGKTVGPPWTADQKAATLAALLLLAGHDKPMRERTAGT